MKNIFTNHPHSINESYFQHFRCAFYFGASMVVGGLACILHAIFPFMFQKTGSNVLLKMSYFFIDRMPCMEERVLELSRLIEEKAKRI